MIWEVTFKHHLSLDRDIVHSRKRVTAGSAVAAEKRAKKLVRGLGVIAVKIELLAAADA